MSTTFIAGFVAFLAAYAGSRILTENAMKKLSIEDQAKLVGGLSNLRIVSIVLVLVMGVLIVVAPLAGVDANAILWGNPLILLGFVVAIGWLTWRRMKELMLPETFIRSMVIASVVRFAGIAALIWSVLLRTA
jgi:hypothetical protein